ncbi:MAG: hypothetical protein Q8P02_02515, partial [Candidatus Micrarchaeota archaeon]|nr:hypothetical protein [Candidatus Micrarchaeota archaeon]
MRRVGILQRILLSSGLVLLFAMYVVLQPSAPPNAFPFPFLAMEPKTDHALEAAAGVAYGTPLGTLMPPVEKGRYAFEDGEFTGQMAAGFYGNVRVKVVIADGAIRGVQF